MKGQPIRAAPLQRAQAVQRQVMAAETKEKKPAEKKEKKEPEPFTPPQLDPNTPSPIFGGSTGGLLRKAQVGTLNAVLGRTPSVCMPKTQAPAECNRQLP